MALNLIATWRLDDGPGEQPTTAVDSGGHTNDHSGTYVHSAGYGLRPGGATSERRSLFANGSSRVGSILNPADLRITGEMSISMWAGPHGDAARWASCGGNSEAQADNVLWAVGTTTNRRLWFMWENGAGVDVVAMSPADVRSKFWFWEQFAFIRRLHGGGPNLEVEFIVNGASVGIDDNSGAGFAPPDGGGNSVPLIGCDDALASDPSLISKLSVWDNAQTVAKMGIDYYSELQYIFGIAKYYGGSYNPNLYAGWL